jgi:hypothetical protein
MKEWQIRARYAIDVTLLSSMTALQYVKLAVPCLECRTVRKYFGHGFCMRHAKVAAEILSIRHGFIDSEIEWILNEME